MNGRDDAAAFLPLDFRIGDQSRDSHPTVGQYLTRDQARHIHKKVEMGGIINVDTVEYKIEQEKQLSQMDDDNGEVKRIRWNRLKAVHAPCMATIMKNAYQF